MKLSKGKKNIATRCVIYGTEGIGKSTLASNSPDPLFIDIEGGTNQLDVKRIEPAPVNWKELINQIDYVINHPDVCRTLVIDTIDAAEPLAIDQVCNEEKITSIAKIPHGNGYVLLDNKIIELIQRLDRVIEAGINVIVIAHSQVKKFTLPDEMGEFDRYELKLQKRNSPKFKEWCDALLFCNYKTFMVADNQGMSKTNKIRGGERVIYTTHHPAWDAKNRFGLAEELPLEYNSIKDIFTLDIPDSKLHKELSDIDLEKIDDETPLEAQEPEPVFDEDFTEINTVGIPIDLARLMERDSITEEEIIDACIKANMIPEFNEMQNRRTRISDLGLEFIQKNLITPWDGFVKFVKGM